MRKLKKRRKKARRALLAAIAAGSFLWGMVALDGALNQSFDNPGSNWSTTTLGDALLNEWIGTTDTENNAENMPLGNFLKTFPTWLAETTHMPFLHPEVELEDAYFSTPSTFQESGGGTQSPLLSSIANWQSVSHKIALGWMPAESTYESDMLIKDNPGMNVVSPSWLELQNASGQVSSQVNPAVIQYAHQHHVQVWALFDNQFLANMTHQFLSSKASEMRCIQQLVQIAKQNQLNGINLDFENLDDSDQSAYTTFVARLHKNLQAIHVDLSVDVTADIVPLVDNSAYFHAGLADVSDQLILMAYDEHWAADPTPGPVADMPWVKSCVNDLLDTGVPADKLLLGIPMYTRFWTVVNGQAVNSEAVGLDSVASILAEHQAKSEYQPSLDLMYAQYPVNGGTEEVWYANQQTFSDKLQLVNNDGLAGVAVWSLPFSQPSIWTSMINNLQKVVT
ncbi:glycosyl hydrolase family 18 protein [Alicyclobacillus tolerans]|uniref:glycosyl hydrolase family 18 protein n=1 Tax=Alicyclobacillus tolerans TaxID=90970 RepID=UPI003B7DC9D0